MWRFIRSRPFVTGLALVASGLVLLVGGAMLIHLGGSAYYAIAGALLIASGSLVLWVRAAGYALYAAGFVGTWIWSLTEVGLDGWRLMPRLIVPALFGLWFSMPWVLRKLHGAPALRHRWYLGALGYALSIIVIIALGYRVSASRWVQPGQVTASNLAYSVPEKMVADGDWRWYGRDPQGTRFAPLNQITPANVGKLELAWTFHTGDLPRPGESSNDREFNDEVTPIKVGERLYACTPHRDVVALDPVTGRQIWRFHPDNDTSANMYLACRGVAYYDAPVGAPCPHRIVSTTADARLFELDAQTGQLCTVFGKAGYVDLREGMGVVPPGFHFITSQPLVLKGKIMLSGWVYDDQSLGEPSGVIRAFNAADGQLAWAWDLGRPDPTSPLGPGEVYTRGTPNGWGTFTADPALGLVFVPLGIATPDYWGGHRRPFDESYDTSLVALEIDSGKERWHYQMVHHDVWDFDIPIGPSLIELPDDKGGSVPALVQTTKMGQIFLLDRRDGHPLAPVVERPVPQQGLPGDPLAPTQPSSVGMPDLGPADLTEAGLWGASPIDQMLCRIQFRSMRYSGRFTPPTLGGVVLDPAFDGVVDWYGGTLDPTHDLLIANTSYIPFTLKPLPTAQAVRKGIIKPWAGWGSGEPYPEPAFRNNPEWGTPFAAVVKPWLNLLGAPCNAPPWGTLVAIDLRTRQIVWQRPAGTTRDTNLFGTHLNLPLPTGIFSIGGNIVTASGLIFVGAYADDYLRAFDERTGTELWRARLPAGGQATPMSYRGTDGRQYVVIAAGGHGGLGTRPGDAILAYALPDH